MANKSGKVRSPILIVILAALVVAAVLIAASQWSAHQHRMALNPPSQPQAQPQQPEEGAQAEAPAESQLQQPEEQAQTGQMGNPPETATSPTLVWPPTEGNPDAPVTIVEFADFYCPYCARYLQETYPQIAADYIEKNLVRYEFRNLVVHGPPALLAAVGGVCAEEQGEFWNFHKRFYETAFQGGGEHQVDEAGLKQIAADIGLDVQSFASCVQGYSQDFNRCFNDYQSCTSGGGGKDQCAADFNQCLSGNELATTVLGDQGVLRALIEGLPPDEQAKAQRIGTPLFFINNHILVGAQPYDNFRKLIDQALEEAKSDGS